MDTATLLVCIIIGLPLVGFIINGLLGLSSERFRKKRVLIGVIANAVVLIPFLAALYFFVHMDAASQPIVIELFKWIDVGSFSVDIAYQIDQLSIIMMLIVTGVGFLIHLYTVGYMWEDEGYCRFFSYLNLFIFSMLNLVMGANLLLLFLGWEGVGLCSYILISFWYSDMDNAAAGKKAFIYNRIGDFAFLIAMFMTFYYVGSLEFSSIFASLAAIPAGGKFTIGILMLVGATGKSAQIPLYPWLPDAMLGPTPISALIHAATMVTSGVYLISRMSPMYVMSPKLMMIIAVVGALTAIAAATVAITRNDIKRVLAYSTISQLGYMFLALGSGAFTAAIFHLVTHAFFKACLFLGSGSIIHTMEHVEHELHEEGKEADFDPQDMRFMGGLKKYMPSTYWTFLIATLAISGIPPLAGFFSKDEILAYTLNAGLGEYAGALYVLLWVVGVVTAFLTAFYMFRLTFGTFNGPFKLPKKVKEATEAEKYLHENDWTMTTPLWALAILSVIGGLIGIPEYIGSIFVGGEAETNWLHGWLHHAVSGYEFVLSAGTEWLLLVISLIFAVGGLLVAWKMYGSGDTEKSDATLKEKLGVVYEIWNEKYNVDEAFEGVISKPLVRFSDKGLSRFDMRFLDGTVNATGNIVKLFGSVFRYVQTGVVGSYALALALGVILVLGILLF